MQDEMILSDAAISEAYAFAKRSHEGQLRRGTDVPYFTHPISVALIYADVGPGDVIGTVVALLHDVVEDCGVSIDVIRERFGNTVAIDVQSLTKIPGSSKNGDQLFYASTRASDVKCCDIAHNASDVDEQDPEFAHRWLLAKKRDLRNLVNSTPHMLQYATDAVGTALAKVVKKLEPKAWQTNIVIHRRADDTFRVMRISEEFLNKEHLDMLNGYVPFLLSTNPIQRLAANTFFEFCNIRSSNFKADILTFPFSVLPGEFVYHIGLVD